ncbi:MAG TPA: SprB repeat-containing protein, partial [Puia sp.]|nr:SprB repeat-containing protein [Puia sp.]
VLSVSVSGGTAPYQFSKDGITYQNDGNFGALASGDYTITAMDVNGCRLGNDYVIQSLYPAMTVSHSVRAVQCNGGSDGSVQLDVSGGFGGYAYQWSRMDAIALPVTGPAAGALTAGTYIVHITDEKGCGAGDTAAVSQPRPLSANLTVRPVCSDVTSGRVRVAGDGGTPPYRYASDGGDANSDSAFNELSAGQHTLWITDSHGCSWSQAVTIPVNPLVPSVDFLVATKQNVLDTLQVEDISSPKPDSVQWTFDPATLLLGSNPDGPMVRFSQTGTYPASMRAWYGGCDFSVTKNILIQPYDSSSSSAPVRAGLSIDTASMAPNPNAGNFHLYVKLYKAQRLLLTITTLSGQPVYRKQWDGQDMVSEQVVLPGYIVSGAYMAELVTETDVRDYTILVTK